MTHMRFLHLGNARFSTSIISLAFVDEMQQKEVQMSPTMEERKDGDRNPESSRSEERDNAVTCKIL